MIPERLSMHVVEKADGRHMPEEMKEPVRVEHITVTGSDADLIVYNGSGLEF